MKFVYPACLTFVLWIACHIPAQAHAFPDHSDPKVGGTVNPSPPAVRIWFTRNLTGTSSIIQVFDSKGSEVDKRDSSINGEDKTLMSVSLPALKAGSYKVTWQAVTTDTHHTSGSFTFEVTGH